MKEYKDLNDYEIIYMVKENDEEAKNILFQKYYPVILSSAKKFLGSARKNGMELDDLIQEGYVGLDAAMKNYNADCGTIFYTYAVVSIRSKMLNCFARRQNKNSEVLHPISLFSPVSSSLELSLIDVMEDKNALLPHLVAEENDLMSQIKEFVYSLDFPNSLILELKINGFDCLDISKLLDISYRSVSNILYHLRKELKSYLFGD